MAHLDQPGDTTMFTNTKIALAAALILGAASAALANDIETNPSTAQSVREWQESLGKGHMGNDGNAYGYFPSQQQDLSRRKGYGRQLRQNIPARWISLENT